MLGLNVIERDQKRAFLATKGGFEAIALEQGSASDLTRLSFQAAPDSDLGGLARTLDQHGIKSERPQHAISPGVAQALVFADVKAR